MYDAPKPWTPPEGEPLRLIARADCGCAVVQIKDDVQDRTLHACLRHLDRTPPPAPFDPDKPVVGEELIHFIRQRMALGKTRYNTYLQPHNGRDMRTDALEECLDLAQYLMGALIEAERDASHYAERWKVQGTELERLRATNGCPSCKVNTCDEHIHLPVPENLQQMIQNAEILSASTLDEALEMQVWKDGFDSAQEVLRDQHKRILALEKLLKTLFEQAAEQDIPEAVHTGWEYYKAQPLFGYVKEGGKQAEKVEVPREVADALALDFEDRGKQP